MSTTPTLAASASVSQKPAGPSRLYDVPFLDDNGSNYQSWKFRTQTVLEIRGLWPVVNGDELRPGTVNSAEQMEWDFRNKEARAQISLTLSDEPLSGIIYVKSAKEI